MPVYNYDTLLVNSRPVNLMKILSGKETPGSVFEADAFLFIREWFGKNETFTFNTSGSTGTPKLITFSRYQLEASASATIQALDLKPAETSLVCLNTKFIAGKMMLVRSFINQMKIILVDPTSNPLEKIDPEVAVDFLACVPLQIQSLLTNKCADRLNKIRNIIIGGAPLNDSVRKQISSKLITNVYATYGMTETLTHIALNKITENRDDIFRTLPGVILGIDKKNCLMIKTPFLDDPVTTNDMVDLVSPTSFRWKGRWDNVINTGGVKVNPEVLESKLEAIFSRLNIQRRYFIAGLPDPGLGNQVALIIEGDPLTKEAVESLQKEILNTCAKFEIPRQILAIKQFYDTSTGKINRIATMNLL